MTRKFTNAGAEKIYRDWFDDASTTVADLVRAFGSEVEDPPPLSFPVGVSGAATIREHAGLDAGDYRAVWDGDVFIFFEVDGRSSRYIVQREHVSAFTPDRVITPELATLAGQVARDVVLQNDGSEHIANRIGRAVREFLEPPR